MRRPSVRVLRRYLPHFRLFSWKRLFFYLAILVPLFSGWVYLGYRSYTRALCFEQAYYKEIDRHNSLESQWRWVPDLMSNSPKPLPYNKRLTPLIHDVVQLYSWGYKEQLSLNEDGTAKYPNQQNWIYVGGTPKKPSSILESLSVFSPPNGSCTDESYICHSFNEAFNQLLENYHTTEGRYARNGRASLGFVDCDVSPLLCDDFHMDPVMLLHVQTKRPCTPMRFPEFDFNCSVKWSLVPLPLKKMPFTSLKIIPGGRNAVPVFPSAIEQLSAMVSWEGSIDGIDLKDWEVYETIPEGALEE